MDGRKSVCAACGLRRNPPIALCREAPKSAANPPSDAGPVRRIFAEFRGKSPASSQWVCAASGTPADLAKLGGLKKIRLADGRVLSFDPRTAALAADAGRRLHITGARLAVRGGQNPGEEFDAGEIAALVYVADKPHIDGGEVTEYTHEMGEETGIRPHLIIDGEGFPLIEGGDYDITADGIIN